MIWGRCSRPGCGYVGWLHVAFTGWQLCDICFTRKVKWIDDAVFDHRTSFEDVRDIVASRDAAICQLQTELRDVKAQVALLQTLAGTTAPRKSDTERLREMLGPRLGKLDWKAMSRKEHTDLIREGWAYLGGTVSRKVVRIYLERLLGAKGNNVAKML